MFGRRRAPVGGGSTTAVMPDLLGLFRLQGRPVHTTFNPWFRNKFSPSAVRPSSGLFSQLNQSVFQPVNVPTFVQVDVAPEYMPPWPFNGDVGYLERQGYTQDPQLGQMLPLPQLPYSLRVPQPSTLPWFVAPKGVNRG